MRNGVITAVVFAVTLCFSAYTFSTAHALTCSGGTQAQLATQLQADSVADGSIVAGKTYVCPEDVRLGISNQVGDAKNFLLSIAQGLPGSAAPPNKDNVQKLNDTFAVCAANFLKAYKAKYGAITMSSAYREGGGPDSPNALAGGAPGSNHTKGLAIDVNPTNRDYPTLWKFASSNPKFGVCFPYLSGDRPHMTLAGSGTGEAQKCAAQGVTKPCDGVPFNPSAISSVKTPTLSTPFIQTTQQLQQGLSGALGITSYSCEDGSPTINGQCPQVCVNGSVIVNNMCYPPNVQQQCANTFSLYNQNQCNAYQQLCPQGFMPYAGACYPMSPPQQQMQPQQQQPGAQPQQQSQQPTTGSNGNLLQNPLSPQLLNTNSNTNTNTSAIDLINQFANGRATTSATSSAPISLNAATLDIVQLIAQAPSIPSPEQNLYGSTSSGLMASTSALGTIQSLEPGASRSTFTSNDLRATEDPATSYSLQQNAFTMTVLENLKTSLQRFIQYLKQIGGT